MKILTTAMILAVAFLSGCAVSVPTQAPSANLTEAERFPETQHVVVQVPEKLGAENINFNGLIPAGFTMEWNVKVGEILTDSTHSFFQRFFENVEVQTGDWSEMNCQDCSLIVRPKIVKTEISEVTLQTKVKVEVKVLNSLYREVAVFYTTGESPLLTSDRISANLVGLAVPLFKETVGRYLVARSVNTAVENSYTQMEQKLKQAMSGGELARTWLPKRLLSKREFGVYEFGAEKIARRAGCDLASDGIELLTTGTREVYLSHCWNIEPFLIECENGNCQKTDQLSINEIVRPAQTLSAR